MSVSPTPWPRLVRALRRRQGLSQQALADRLGVDQTAVSRWERGLDEPRLALRRRLLDLQRKTDAGRQDAVVRARVRSAFWPSSLVGPGAVFLEINQPAVAEAGMRPTDLRGRPIYGLFGPAVDAVTERWEAAGIFRGDLAMTISVNTLEGPGGPVHIRTMDTPHFTSDGEIWCVCDIQRIDAPTLARLKDEFGGATFHLPFDVLTG